MNILETIFGAKTYPVFGFGGDMRAMTADQILQMQCQQQWAMQQAYAPHSLSYLSGSAQYRPLQPPQRPLDERFAEFKIRLAAALEKRVHRSV